MANRFDVFFSYNREDWEIVQRVREALESRGVQVWMDDEIAPGEPWMQKVQGAIAQAPAAIIFLGPHGLGSWQEPEIEACIDQNVERGLSIVPVPLPGLPDDTEIFLFLKRFTWVDLRQGSLPLALNRLTRAVLAKSVPLLPVQLSGGTTHAPRLHNLPLSPLGELFKGRDEELRRLIANLRSLAPATALTQAQAISGLGGIGKTRLAIEYAWHSGDLHDAAFFVVADSPAALQSGLASLAGPSLLNLPWHDSIQGQQPSAHESFIAVVRWLREHSRWLLILDNVDAEDAAKAVREILPQLTNGHVLLTSRRREWPPAVRKQPIGELEPEQATQFLLQRTEGGRASATDDTEQARHLAVILGGLPLALEQAAAYIVHHQTTFAEYLKEWEREREEVLGWHDESIMDYPFSVATTWQTTFHQLLPKAAAILRLAAFLAPDPIPESMFQEREALIEEAAQALSEEMGQPSTAETVRESLAELAAYSMVARSNGTFMVHRVVQLVLRTRTPEIHRQKWIGRCLNLLDSYFPLDLDETIRSATQQIYWLSKMMDQSIFGINAPDAMPPSTKQIAKIFESYLGPEHRIMRNYRWLGGSGANQWAED